MEDYSRIVAKNIASLRKSRDLTQQDFAKILNYSDKTISKWELGYAIPNVETLKQIADYFEVTVDYLLEPHAEIEKSSLPQMDRTIRRVLIMILFDLFFILIGTTIFAAIATVQKEHIIYWPIFIWTIAASTFFNSIYSNKVWRHSLLPYIFASATIWIVLIAVYMTIIYADVNYNFWYLFFVGLPVQFAVIIILSLSHSTSK